jgi:putative phosphoesterase
VKIALISDTHIPPASRLLPQLVEHLRQADLILHAGDLVCLDVLESLQVIAETIAVHGNTDEPAVVHRLPRKRLLELTGRWVGLIHGDRATEIEQEYLRPDYDYDSPPVRAFYDYLLDELPGCEIVVFGHFHVPVVRRERGCLLINPGSAYPCEKRSGSLCMLELDTHEARAEIIEL